MPAAGRKGARYRRSLTEKLAIVRESMAPGSSAAQVARRHQVSANVLYYWRKVYRELLDADLSAVPRRDDVADLELQVRNLERLLGQRTLEVALLREKLGLPPKEEDIDE
ncbi:MAG TPA: transposase [Usitatibacter sp.]|nr:transposase [Usitatibacter sp.]